MRLDAHQHFWRYTAAEYGWLEGPLAALRRDFLPDDLAPLLAAAGVAGTIAVQARQSLEETEWLLGLARKDAFIRAVVGWVPLADPQVGDILDTLAAETRFKGVRHVAQGQPPGFFDAPDFNAGIRQLTARGLTYDLLIFANQLEEVIRFVDRHPQQAFVLDHIAKPAVGNIPPAAWCTQLRELARRDHVCCKFSGLVTEVTGGQWTDALLRPYWEETLAAFGPHRLMFGSDWPVCLAASDYARWHAFVARCAARLTAAEQASVLGGTAAGFYRL
jgi:L-fuconolactonase